MTLNSIPIPIVMLVDNGSVKPAATLQLRQLAEKLSQKSQCQVHAVSLRHADRISPGKLDGKRAETFMPFLAEQLKGGSQRFIVLPLFFAESDAVSRFIPQQVARLQAQFGKIDITIADVVYPLPEGENRLLLIISGFIQSLIKNSNEPKQNIVLVDHGSPSQKVTAVRQHIATALQKHQQSLVVEQAVMERREGTEYDFNGPLLENWLIEKAAHGEKSAIVSLLFFLPGRHAGKGGDIENICNRIKQQYPDFEIYLTPLIADHEGLIDILQSRLQGCI